MRRRRNTTNKSRRGVGEGSCAVGYSWHCNLVCSDHFMGVSRAMRHSGGQCNTYPGDPSSFLLVVTFTINFIPIFIDY